MELGDGNPAMVSISSGGGVGTWPSMFRDELEEYPCRLLIRKLLEDGETAMSSLSSISTISSSNFSTNLYLSQAMDGKLWPISSTAVLLSRPKNDYGG